MDGEDVVFHGNSGHECEEFIRAVRKAGFQAQKIRDDAWMADYASTCLTGRALRYYETLSPEVQGDWRLLRQALLKEYPPRESDNAGAQAGGSSNPQAPTPAAAAPAPSQKKRGLIKVKGTDGEDFGYLGFGVAATKSSLGAGFAQDKALSVSYTSISQQFEIDIEQPSGKRKVLGIHWNSTPTSARAAPDNYAVVTAFDCDGSNRSSGMAYTGAGQTSVWSIMSNNTLVAYWNYGSVNSALSYMIYTSKSCESLAVDVLAEDNSLRQPWKRAILSVEPLML
ncbi:hypothetical protein FRC01_013315 [Tulasnella sp. 417]|nr:hypothetical protein FRC01_013315 [Tulasnella sp. 417]